VIIVGLLVSIVVLIGLVVLGLGLLVLWGSAGNLWERWAAFVGALRSRDWVETQGTVTRSVVAHRRSRRNVFYLAAIRYSYCVDGKRFDGERLDFDETGDGTFEGAQATVARFPLGSGQRVYYEPALPRWSTLARNVPPVFLASLGWLIVGLVGVVLAGFGVDIVFGAFDEPPELGELPSLRAQLGGLLVGVGTLAVAIGGIRALLERKTRRMLRYLASAKPTQNGDIRAGDRVAVFGRAEEDEEGPDDEVGPDQAGQEELAEAGDEELEEHALADPSQFELPFVKGTVFYLHTDLGSADGDMTQVTSFVVRDETGVVSVELSPGQGLLSNQKVPIQGEVEQWLDQHDLELGSSVPADRRAAMKVERICEGDSVLIVGQAFKAGARVVLRAHGDEPLALLFADKPLPDVVKKLKRGPRTTLALCAAGSLSIISGAIALFA
jgi:hypothetical protein